MNPDLNPQQLKAVKTIKGPLLILAGAGSGKTRTLTQRVAFLVSQGHARPFNILAVTFTNKAATEMKERIASLVSKNSGYTVHNFPWIGTFHSLGVKILRREGNSIGINTNFTIFDTTDQRSLVTKAIKDKGLSPTKVNPRAVINIISAAKTNLLSPTEFAKTASGYFENLVADIYPIYQEMLDRNQGLDFDDLIRKPIELFIKEPAILDKYQDIFKYILIDEYQDTNHSQYILIKMLAEKNNNICVVGDDAQSIYSFRGATITNILNFERDYPDAKVIKLEQNYRSTKNILEASNYIIKKNVNQKPKTLWTEKEPGEKIQLYQATNEKDEAKWISEQIRNLLLHNNEAKEIAVLYRTNAQSRALEEAMLIANISYKIVGNLKFYQRKEVKDILSYLRILNNKQDDLSLTRIINVPKRGIGNKTVEKLSNITGESQSLLEKLLETPDPKLKKISKNLLVFKSVFLELQDRKGSSSLSSLIDSIVSVSGYYKMLKDEGELGLSKLENIQELKSVATKYDKHDSEKALIDFLEEVALVEGSYKSEKSNEQEQITLMTVHAAKGLEFENVFISGMEENIFPHSNAKFEEGELEEERRLAYVAVTRAKRHLCITYSESRMYFGSTNYNPVSRFVEDIPVDLTQNISSEQNSYTRDSGWLTDEEFDQVNSNDDKPPLDVKVGDLVKHEIFGVGEVRDIDEFIISVKFSMGVKELALEYVNLNKV